MNRCKFNFKATEKQITYYVGIDVHKKRWVVTIRALNLELKTFSMNPSPKELFKYLNRHWSGGLYLSCYEAGFCGFWIHKELTSLGLDNRVVNAADVPTKNKDKVNKKDKVDSRKLARELEKDDLDSLYVPALEHQQLRSLGRLRSSCRQQIVRLKNRIKGHLCFYGIQISDTHAARHWSGAFIRELENCYSGKNPGSVCLSILLEELKEQRLRLYKILRELRDFCKECGFSHTLKCLRSIPGIGFVTAVTLVTEIMDISRFKKFDQLCSMFGLVPSTNSSGESDRVTGLTPRRNKYLKHIIIESSWMAVRMDPSLFKAYANLSTRMSKTNAIVRIARKLLNRIRYVWKNQTPYKVIVEA